MRLTKRSAAHTAEPEGTAELRPATKPSGNGSAPANGTAAASGRQATLHAPQAPRRRLRARRPAQGQEGAGVRRRERPLDRLGNRQGAVRAGRRRGLQLDGLAHQAARPAARRRRSAPHFVEGCDVRDDDEIKQGLRALGHARTATSTSWSTPSPTPRRKTWPATSPTPAATASTPPSTSASTR